MNPVQQRRAVAILLMILSGAWLCSRLELVPGIEWGAIVAIGLLGALTLALGAIDRQTFVIGFFLLIASMVSILRETEHLSADLVVPSLMVTFGLLLLVSQIIPNPVPRFPQVTEGSRE